MKKTASILILTLGLFSAAAVTAPPAAAIGKEERAHIEALEVMQGWVDFLAHFIDVIEDPSNAIGLAQNSLKDLYVENGEPERVIQVLNETLKVVEDRGGRNAIRFTLAEMHKNLGQPKEASDQLLKIIEENAKGDRGGYKAPSIGGAVSKSVFE